MAERSVLRVRSALYRHENSQWVPIGNQSGLSVLEIFLNQATQRYRIVGRADKTGEVVWYK